MKTLVDIQDLHVDFPGHQAVRGLNLTINAGETLALVGESGCGKSATALSLMRLVAEPGKISGRILFDGQDLLTLPDRQMRQLRGNALSMIFQEPMTSLNPVLSIGQQISETLRLHEALTPAQARTRATELLDLVKIPEPARRVDDYPHNLSGGQRQRVMIAMAVACRPRLLIADEPTTALDVTIQAQILALLDNLRREFSMSLLLITHDLGLVAQWADRVAVMYAGQKVEEAQAADLFQSSTHRFSPKHSYTRGLLATSLHMDQDRHYRTHRLAEIHHAPTDEGFTLLTPPTLIHRAIDTNQPPLLSLKNIHTRYSTAQGKVLAVDDVSLTILPGETLGLVGESGCGKSTLSKTILRLLPPSHGQIVFDGQDITTLKESRLKALRQRVQMIFQDPYASLNPRHSIQHILETPLIVHGLGDRSQRQQAIKNIIDRVGLPQSSLSRYPHEFSGGQRQRIGIARALVVRPSLVICDEPVSALDVSIQAQILNLLVELKNEMGLSLLFISHDLAVVRYIADRVMVMQNGRCVESGDHHSIWHQPQHPYTRKLIDAVPGGGQRDALVSPQPRSRQAHG
ncbi:glutathione ABC transporter ATP-binding protein GsiA [Pectobacterium odoriferum]|uniref:ABC-type dipeptide transporter n=1 Tax=Pectobacterium odoriferum TaxID=78398 RepID=A0ABD6VTN3_9GAMM|nr:ABC transporter ATP-binding protein [Pectobacterium odoriferum]POD91928.1 glutathione ABC transporter ATP-binding protein GsiA [Pectobacterium odoriferum]POD97822.1 glutathione ABC transporter ATP-binding protein GsiA [Pectobacterium odoriferum]POE10960.1 glutathione ABC transporter ATP-binding protein GsiA [Pectobacterium odoriferum]POE14003.1 glutathione ABC transporter ATP-binding protein GsiA [Pectobacterium odoriferum]POE27786.1 glutathione ABC transporter ATP-binding protein GsiA [Pec